LKKIDKSVVNKIKNTHLDNISKSPLVNDRLKGELKDLYSYHFKEQSVEYRIAYAIEDDEIIFYMMIAKRENFYKKIKSRIVK
jgi:addiction module RelE/StbE family toxin